MTKPKNDLQKERVVTYDVCWPFWLDDACYRVGRGNALLALPGEVSRDLWTKEIMPEVDRLEKEHGVRIWVEGDEVVEIHVGRYLWVFALLEAVRARNDERLYHALCGVLLGYDGPAIDEYINAQKSKDGDNPDGKQNASSV